MKGRAPNQQIKLIAALGFFVILAILWGIYCRPTANDFSANNSSVARPEQTPDAGVPLLATATPFASPVEVRNSPAVAETPTQLTWGPEPTAQDYDIWYAAVSDQVRLGTANVWHLIEPVSVFDRGESKSGSSFPDAGPTAEAWELPGAELDLDKFKWAAERSLYKDPPPRKIELLHAAQLAAVAGGTPKPPWLISPRLIPNSEAVIRLSWPAYRSDGRAAYLLCVVCTEWWGSIMECKVDKDFRTGKWKLGKTRRRDITHWKDGKLFIDE